jgi:hypothetical protein
VEKRHIDPEEVYVKQEKIGIELSHSTDLQVKEVLAAFTKGRFFRGLM